MTMGEEEIPFELTDTDRENLLAGDERFTPISWEELKQTIGSLALPCSIPH